MTEVCLASARKTTFGSARPAGSRRDSGRLKDVLRIIDSTCRCQVQKPPFRSLSRSSGPGRCRCRRVRPSRAAVSTTPPIGSSVAAPFGCIASAREVVGTGLLFSKASSLAGRSVKIWTDVSYGVRILCAEAHVLLIYGHRPPSSNAGISIDTECHPERPSTLLAFCPVFRRR